MKHRGRHIFISILATFTLVAVYAVPAITYAAAEASGDNANSSKAFENSTPEIVKAGLEILALPVAAILFILFSIVQRIVNIAAWTFNLSIQTMVIGMADLVNTNAGINIGWSVLRDIANTAILFALIYIGFMTILRASGSGWKRMLGMIIISAILVNFSMVIAKVVIDISNVMSVEIAKSLNAADPTGVCTNGSTADDFAVNGCIDRGVASVFLNMFNLDSVMSGFGKDAHWYQGLQMSYLMVIGILLSLLVSFVFFAGAILLVSRFIVLVVLIVFSPLAFAAFAFPGLQNRFRGWYSKLINQSFFAPAFFFMLWLSAKVTEAFYAASTVTGSTASAIVPPTPQAQGDASGFLAALSTQNVEYTRVFIFFALTSAFFIASLVVSKRMGAYGASTAVGWLQSARNRTWRYTKGAAGRTVDATAGSVGRAIASGISNVEKREREEKDFKRKWYNPVRWALAPSSVRSGAQRLGKLADARTERMKKNLGRYSTAEINSQLGGGALSSPDVRKAAVAIAVERGELNKLDPKLVERTTGNLRYDYKDITNITRQAPALVQYAGDENAQIGVLEKALPRQTAEEVRKMNEEMFTKLKESNLKTYEAIFETMVKKYTGTQAGALFQEGNTITDEFAKQLLLKAKLFNDSPQGKKLVNNIDFVADYLKRGGEGGKAINNTLGNWVKGNAGRKVLNAYWADPNANIRDEDDEDDEEKSTT